MARTPNGQQPPSQREPFEERLAKWMLLGFGIPIILLLVFAGLHAMLGTAGVLTLLALLVAGVVLVSYFWYRAKHPPAPASANQPSRLTPH